MYAIRSYYGENLHLTNWTTLYDEIIEQVNPDNKYYIFLDEVQLIDDFERLVNSLFTKKNIDLYVTGSNAYLLSSELATLLTGRYIAINLQPYSFKEYVSAYSEEKNTDRLFRKYINESCFPEAVTLSNRITSYNVCYTKLLRLMRLLLIATR